MVNKVEAPAGYKVIGTRPVRHDGVDRVTGRAVFGADIKLPEMLAGAIARSPHAHARIVAIDTSEAEKAPGVKAVVTAADLPEVEDRIEELGEGSSSVRYQSMNILARDKVLYYGHAVAGVAAVNQHLAAQAAQLIKVTYELLPPVMTVEDATRQGAPILLDDLRTDELGAERAGPTNIAKHIQHKRGDPEQGFRAADVIVEREFWTATVHQGYIEPTNATAVWSQDGQITVWTSTQAPFDVRNQLSDVLGLPVARIRVVPMEIGGGFGGKVNVYLEPVAALLSRKSGHRPVKLVMSRAEVLAATGPTSGGYIKVKMGADRQGRLTAATAHLAYEAGAFPGSPVGAACGVILAPYRLDNVQIDGYDVVVNRPKSAAYRAPGGSNAAFASETVVDELCEKLGVDPLQFRLINGVKQGDRRADGPVYRAIAYRETVQAAMQHPHYTAPLGGPNRGRGVAAGFWFNGGGKSSASCSVNRDGSVNLVTGSVDLSGTRTSLAMQFAETVGIPVSAVRPTVGDTQSVGYTAGSYGSRTTFATGLAVHKLGQALKQEMMERAAQYWGLPAVAVTYEGGYFAGNGERLSFKELAEELNDEAPITASASVNPDNASPAFAVHIADVEVDPETGKIQILRYTAVQDVGTAIHPAMVESQMQGGAVQGIGWALNEEYVYDREGHLLNASFLDYREPTALDLPMIDTVLVEVPNPEHPYGVRGVGEVPIVPPPATLANALYRAGGVRMNVLPMSPRHVLEAIWRQQGDEG